MGILALPGTAKFLGICYDAPVPLVPCCQLLGPYVLCCLDAAMYVSGAVNQEGAVLVQESEGEPKPIVGGILPPYSANKGRPALSI